VTVIVFASFGVGLGAVADIQADLEVALTQAILYEREKEAEVVWAATMSHEAYLRGVR